MKQVTICVDQDEIQLALTLLVDPEVFTEELAELINTFWSGHEERLEESGSHRTAALKLIAAECFAQASFNNFIHAEYVMNRFDCRLAHGGIEGFPSFHEAGLNLTNIDNFHFPFEAMECAEVDWK